MLLPCRVMAQVMDPSAPSPMCARSSRSSWGRDDYLMLEITLLVSVEPPVLLTITVVKLLLIRLS